MARVVALMDDLFFQMKLAETAKHLGVEVKVAATGEALQALLEPPPKLLIVDLNSRSQPIAAIQRLRADKNAVRVVAFLSHVQTELAAQARAARNLDFHRNVGQRERGRDVPGGIARRAEQREYCDTE